MIFIYNLYLVIILIIITIIIIYVYNKSKNFINKKKIYIGCLYSTSGIYSHFEKHNYYILLECFKHGLHKYSMDDVEIITLFKDLESDKHNYLKWVEECIKTHNVKYFFGCWRGDQRKIITETLKKNNVKLFFPLQYEGAECENSIYYFGSTPNQQIIPALNYYFSKFEPTDVYIVGCDCVYPKIVIEIITNFIDLNKNIFNKKIIKTVYQKDKDTDFTELINEIFKKSPNGAIIINNINNIVNFNNFVSQFNNKFYSTYNVKNTINIEIDKITQEKDTKPIVASKYIYDIYPMINFSFPENNMIPDKIKIYYKMAGCVSFADNLLYNDSMITFINNPDVQDDISFLKNYSLKNNTIIGDMQYCTFISVLFFLKTIKELMNKNIDINNTIEYDKNKLQSLTTITGHHSMLLNNHINKPVYFVYFDSNGRYFIENQTFRLIEANSYYYLTHDNTTIFCNLSNDFYKNNLFLV
jgi:hypothetical protein